MKTEDCARRPGVWSRACNRLEAGKPKKNLSKTKDGLTGRREPSYIKRKKENEEGRKSRLPIKQKRQVRQLRTCSKPRGREKREKKNELRGSTASSKIRRGGRDLQLRGSDESSS